MNADRVVPKWKTHLRTQVRRHAELTVISRVNVCECEWLRMRIELCSVDPRHRVSTRQRARRFALIDVSKTIVVDDSAVENVQESSESKQEGRDHRARTIHIEGVASRSNYAW
jgi:hypothetical protein